jgi:hypothetical protein
MGGSDTSVYGRPGKVEQFTRWDKVKSKKERVVWQRFGRTGGPELTGRLSLSLVPRQGPVAANPPPTSLGGLVSVRNAAPFPKSQSQIDLCSSTSIVN